MYDLMLPLMSMAEHNITASRDDGGEALPQREQVHYLMRLHYILAKTLRKSHWDKVARHHDAILTLLRRSPHEDTFTTICGWVMSRRLSRLEKGRRGGRGGVSIISMI